jgi:RNA polymerase sigma factor (sigma-70 family)
MVNMAELFYEDGVYTGFAGTIKVKNAEVYVNTKTGEGYNEVLAQLSDMISYLASKFDLDGFNLDDNKQHVIIMVLEGIPKFNPNKDTKLSTFLQMRISRRIINEIRDSNRFKNNATFLNIKTYSYRCDCGNVVSATHEDRIETCSICGEAIKKAKKLWIKNTAVSYDSICDGYVGTYSKGFETDRRMDAMDIMDCLENEDEQTRSIVSLMYYQGFSAKDVAEKLGTSQSNVYVKIKNLKHNKRLKEFIRG